VRSAAAKTPRIIHMPEQSPKFTPNAGTAHALSEEERRWVLELREALKEANVTAPASTFELALFALVAKGDRNKGVARITRFNRNVAKYQLDVRSNGASSSDWEHSTLPGYCNGGGRDVHGRQVFCLSAAAIKPSVMAGVNGYAQLCSDAARAVTCDLNCARLGYTALYDCKGVRPWNLSLSVVLMELDLFFGTFACKPKLFLILDAPLIVRSFVRVVRPFLSTKMASRIQFISSTELPGAVDIQSLPSGFGGQCTATLSDWLQARLREHQGSCEAVGIADPVVITDHL